LVRTVAADAEARPHHVLMRRAHSDRLDDGHQVDAGALGEPAPLLDEGNIDRPKAVFHQLGGLTLDRAVEAGQRIGLGVDEGLKEALAGIGPLEL